MMDSSLRWKDDIGRAYFRSVHIEFRNSHSYILLFPIPHHYLRMTDHSVVEHVALLELRDDNTLGSSGLAHDLVILRISLFPERFE